MAGRPRKPVVQSKTINRRARLLLSQWLYDRYSELEEIGWREGKIDPYLGAVREGALMALTEARNFCYVNRNASITAADLIEYLVHWAESPRPVRKNRDV